MTSTNKNSHPLESIIDFAWASGADRFWVNNAKDELKKIRKKLEECEKNGYSDIRKELVE
jgi:hypothetical protein